MESKIKFIDIDLVDSKSELIDDSKHIWTDIQKVDYKHLDLSNKNYLPIFIRTPFTIDEVWNKIPPDVWMLMKESKIKPLISMVTEQWDLFNTYAWKKNKFNIVPDFRDIPYSKVIREFTSRGVAEKDITWIVPHLINEQTQIAFLKNKGYEINCKFLEFDYFKHKIANFTKDYVLKDKIFEKKYACLCQSSVPTRVAHHRLGMIYELYRKNLFTEGMISCTGYINTVESKKSNWVDDAIDTDTFMSNFVDFKKNKSMYLKQLPIDFDNKVNAHYFDKNYNESYIFDKSFLWISNETKKAHDGIFITEKTWKPIAYGNPFVVNGDNGSLDYLKQLGFKTFDKWWDESYDTDDSVTKVKKISKIIEDICKKDAKEIQIMYNEMMPILQHNRNLIQKIDGLPKLKKQLQDG